MGVPLRTPILTIPSIHHPSNRPVGRMGSRRRVSWLEWARRPRSVRFPAAAHRPVVRPAGSFFRGREPAFPTAGRRPPNIRPAIHKSERIVPPWAGARDGSGQRCDPPEPDRRSARIGDNVVMRRAWRPTRSASEGLPAKWVRDCERHRHRAPTPGNPPATTAPGTGLDD